MRSTAAIVEADDSLAFSLALDALRAADRQTLRDRS
jgi:hypothetical protein